MSAGPASRRNPTGRNTAQPAPRKYAAARRLNGRGKDTADFKGQTGEVKGFLYIDLGKLLWYTSLHDKATKIVREATYGQ